MRAPRYQKGPAKPFGDDPLSFTFEDVAAFLDQVGRPGMAGLVRRLGERDTSSYLEFRDLTKQHIAALEELATLKGIEPEPCREPTSYKSEWE